MDVFDIVNVTTMRRHIFCAIILMNVFGIMNVATIQRCGIYVNIPMNVSAILNVVTTQRHMFYAGIPMNIFYNINTLIAQRCKRCSFDSPGLASESEVYPGSFAVSGNNAVGVVPFIYYYFITTFHAENVQHLRR